MCVHVDSDNSALHHHTPSLPVAYVSVTWEACFSEQTLMRTTAKYLFPWPIEFALIGAAVFFNTYRNCDQHPPTDEKRGASLAGSSDAEAAPCVIVGEAPKYGWFHRSWVGLIVGVPASLATIIAVGVFKVLMAREETDTGMLVFYIVDILLLVTAFVAVVVGYIKVSRTLRHVSTKFTTKFNLDVPLLMVSTAGVYAQWVFVLVAFFVSLSRQAPAASTKTYAGLQAFESVLYLMQVTFQTVFILDTFKRSPRHAQHVMKKPGRSVLFFLTVLNTLMWLVNIFLVDKENETEVIVSAYDDLAWTIISHITIPMLIFYRYHSAACLADIWYRAYESGAHMPIEQGETTESVTDEGIALQVIGEGQGGEKIVQSVTQADTPM